MAPAAGNVLKKSAFRCLNAARYVVAGAVTMLMVAVVVYAVKVVHRPNELTLWIVGGSVSVQRSDNLITPFNASVDGVNFTYTMRAVNPSSRVRVYYTDLAAYLQARGETEDELSRGWLNFLTMGLPNLTVEHQSTLDTTVDTTVHLTTDMAEAAEQFEWFYFRVLFNGSSLAKVPLKLSGTRVVQNIFTGHNMTSGQAVYYCAPITFGGDKDDDGEAGVDVPCTEDAPITILDDPLPRPAN